MSGANPPDPEGTVTCHNNHTVDIVITNVYDLDEWTEVEWQFEDSPACQPTFNGTTVTYTGLVLLNCSMSLEQLADSIKYVLKVSATKTGGAGAKASCVRMTTCTMCRAITTIKTSPGQALYR